MPVPTFVNLYGWDSRTETWHGPNELVFVAPDARLLQSLRSAPGGSWFGPVTCATLDEPASRFFTLVHRMPDCATASIYCHESKAGPAELVAVLQPASRTKVREEFAFEFLAFARFLGVVKEAAELHVHEAMNSAISSRTPDEILVFSLSSGLWPSDREHVLSRCVEKLAITLASWL